MECQNELNHPRENYKGAEKELTFFTVVFLRNQLLQVFFFFSSACEELPSLELCLWGSGPSFCSSFSLAFLASSPSSLNSSKGDTGETRVSGASVAMGLTGDRLSSTAPAEELGAALVGSDTILRKKASSSEVSTGSCGFVCDGRRHCLNCCMLDYFI